MFKKLFLYLFLGFVFVGNCFAASNTYTKNVLTGGGAGALDAIDGDDLANGYKAIVINSVGSYFYYLDATSGVTENPPEVISPDANAGNKRWILTDVIDGSSFMPDHRAVDQGLTGSNNTIKYYVDTIGSNDATILLRHNSGGATTTYTLTTSETIPKNITLEREPGVILDGSGTLTFGDGAGFKSGNDQAFGSSITIDGKPNVIQVIPQWWGAIADDAVDDYAAFQAAITFVGELGGGEVSVLSGEYLLSAALDIDTIGISLIGVGNGANAFTNGDGPRLIGTHSAGAVIHVSAKRCAVKNLYIGSDATRKAGAAGANYGIKLEGPDVAGQDGRVTEFQLINTTIEDQPSHGFVGVAAIWNFYIRQCRIADNKGHGIYLDNGTLTSRTNDERPAIGVIELNHLVSNDGHGICVGSDDTNNWGFRLRIENNDIQGNALESAVRREDYQVWLRLENSNVELNVFSSPSTDSEGTGAIFLAGGRLVNFHNNRYIDIFSPAISVNGYSGRNTYGIDVDGMWVDNTVAALDPAIEVNASYVERVIAYSEHYRDIDNLLDGKTGSYTHNVMATINADHDLDQSSTTLQDVTGLAISVEANEIIQFKAIIFYTGDPGADIKLAFTSPSGTLQWCTANGLKMDTVLAIDEQTRVSGTGTSATFGASASNRVIEIVGILKVAGTGGLLQLQAAQDSSVAADTTILDDSSISANIMRY